MSLLLPANGHATRIRSICAGKGSSLADLVGRGSHHLRLDLHLAWSGIGARETFERVAASLDELASAVGAAQRHWPLPGGEIALGEAAAPEEG